MPKFRDIKLFTCDGSWECDYDFRRLLVWIEEEQQELGLNLDPDFQRAHVWTEGQQILWLQHHLKGGKSGRYLYFNHPGWMGNFKGEFVLVDGKQRIEAIRRFLNNEIQVFGAYWDEYEDRNKRIIQNTLRINVNNLKTRADVLRWYIEMNSGGTPHTDEEIARVIAMYEREQE